MHKMNVIPIFIPKLYVQITAFVRGWDLVLIIIYKIDQCVFVEIGIVMNSLTIPTLLDDEIKLS